MPASHPKKISRGKEDGNETADIVMFNIVSW